MSAQRTVIAAAATLALFSTGADAAAVDSAVVAKRDATTYFKSGFSGMSDSARDLDISKFAGNTAIGCTGFLRDGKSCSGGEVNAEIAPNPEGSGNCMKVRISTRVPSCVPCSLCTQTPDSVHSSVRFQLLLRAPGLR